MDQAISIRRSTNQDAPAIHDLAALDSRSAPKGEVLLAFVGTELRAAMPLDGGQPLADPFQRTADIVDLLRVRVGQAGGSWRHGSRRRTALRPQVAQ